MTASFPEPGTPEYQQRVASLAFDIGKIAEDKYTMLELADAAATVCFLIAVKKGVSPKMLSRRISEQVSHLVSHWKIEEKK
jgi:hypothetical protein